MMLTIDHTQHGYSEAVKWILRQPVKTWVSFKDVPEDLTEMFFQILDTNAIVIKNNMTSYLYKEISFIMHENLPWFKIIPEPGILNREKKLS
jgi:hypothetical protein